MEWMVYLIGGIAVAAIVLAIYERRKNLRITYDDPQDPTQRKDRQAFDKAAELRTAAEFQNHTTGH